MKRGGSPATKAQRERVKDHWCLVCGSPNVDPAHIVARSVAPERGDDTRAVAPLCRAHHRAYDEEGLDLLPDLEASGWRDCIAWAVEVVGLIKALQIITNERWGPLS